MQYRISQRNTSAPIRKILPARRVRQSKIGWPMRAFLVALVAASATVALEVFIARTHFGFNPLVDVYWVIFPFFMVFMLYMIGSVIFFQKEPYPTAIRLSDPCIRYRPWRWLLRQIGGPEHVVQRADGKTASTRPQEHWIFCYGVLVFGWTCLRLFEIFFLAILILGAVALKMFAPFLQTFALRAREGNRRPFSP